MYSQPSNFKYREKYFKHTQLTWFIQLLCIGSKNRVSGNCLSGKYVSWGTAEQIWYVCVINKVRRHECTNPLFLGAYQCWKSDEWIKVRAWLSSKTSTNHTKNDIKASETSIENPLVFAQWLQKWYNHIYYVKKLLFYPRFTF